jgi:hypothetical protein
MAVKKGPQFTYCSALITLTKSIVRHKVTCLAFLAILLIPSGVVAQTQNTSTPSKAGWFSLGGRSTLSAFDEDGAGLGTGGQFRIQLSKNVNTDWFADYIVTSTSEGVRSVYYHIGWSVLYYPFAELQYPNVIQPYILAGHCFDYNEKTLIKTPSVSEGRWGSAVQAGIGPHFNLSEKFDISLTAQYMIHLTKGLETERQGSSIFIRKNSDNSLEGHLLVTMSMNYKLFRLWKK